MPCKDCFNNCDKTTSDKCVKYTGPDIEWLGICTGDPLSILEASLIEKLESVINGTGIQIEDLETCDVIDTTLGKNDPTLANLLQATITVICSLKEDVKALQDSSGTGSYVTDCLTLPTNPTKDDILQATTSKLCSVSTQVDDIAEDYVKASELCTLVEECISNTSTSDQEYTKMPKYVALPYHGSLSVFDSNGKGLSAAGYDKVYMCIGQTVNGFTLPDYRGRTPVGANTGMPGGTLDSAVDPTVSENSGYNISQNNKKGAFTHTLTVSQLASHSHSINDPGHTHPISYKHGEADQNESGTSGDLLDNSGTQSQLKNTNSNTTGITIGSAGSSQPHNNTQPSMGTVFIMYVPS